MPNPTNISWAEMTSNPIYAVDKETGKRGWFCTKVSEGCQNCYAETWNKRFGNKLSFTEANRKRVQWVLNERELETILKLQKGQRIFMMDMSDLFHEDIPDEFIARTFGVMATASRHTFLLLTKRPLRMRECLASGDFWEMVVTLGPPAIPQFGRSMADLSREFGVGLRNVWLGVTVENDKNLWRLDELFKCPAAHYFVSCEPLLSGLDLTPWLWGICPEHDEPGLMCNHFQCSSARRLSRVIVGGESGGPPERALVEECSGGWACPECGRAMRIAGVCDNCEFRCPACNGTGWRPKPVALEWVRSLRDQCAAAGVSWHFK